MKKRSGLYPRVHTDATGSGVVSQAGGVTLVETIRAAGMDAAMSQALSPWRKPSAVHDPAKVVLDLAVTLALGGDCLADIARRCCGPSPACTARWPPTRRCLGPSTRWPPTHPARWPPSTPPGRRRGPACGPWPATMLPTTPPTRGPHWSLT